MRVILLRLPIAGWRPVATTLKMSLPADFATEEVASVNG